MDKWFTVDRIDEDTYIISEYRHREETHCYLLKYFSDFYAHEEEPGRGYLFTGDLIYKDTLFAYYPSTDPGAYLSSLEKMALLPVERVFPAHHSLDIQPEIIGRMRDAFQGLKEGGKLHHGSGTFDYGDWAVWL